MALPTGTISMSQVNTELGKSSTAQISLGDTDVRNLAGVSSGAISMADLRGKSASEPLSLSSSGGSNTENSTTCKYVHALGTVTASGGTAPYTYSWSKISGTPTIWSGATSNTLNVRQYMCPDASASGVFRCTVTDSASNTETIDVTFNLFIVNLM